MVAPPAGSRPGWSRRAQYGLFFTLVATIAGVAVGLMLLALSLAAPSRYASIRGAALDVTAPITGSLRSVTTTIGGLTSGAGNYWDAARQNGALRRDNRAMLQRMIEAKAIQLENAN